MIAAWMTFTIMVSLLVAVAVKGGEAVLRLGGLPTRFVWMAALLLSLVLPILGAARSFGSDEASAALVANQTFESAGESRGVLFSAVSRGRQTLVWPVQAMSSHARRPNGGASGLVWLALSLGLATVATVTMVRFRSVRRRLPICEVAGAKVRVSHLIGPAVLGLARPEIVLPAWLLAESPEVQRLVVLHELEHLRARDPWTLAVGWLTVVLIPWNPVSWWLLVRLRLAIELDCDARVLQRGVSRRTYGSVLIDIAGRSPGLSLVLTARPASPSMLERRLTAMSNSLSRRKTIRAAFIGVSGGLALLAACDARFPTSSQVEIEPIGVVTGSLTALDHSKVGGLRAVAEHLYAAAADLGEMTRHGVTGPPTTGDQSSNGDGYAVAKELFALAAETRDMDAGSATPGRP